MAIITMKRGVQQLHGRLHKDSDIVYYVTKSGKQCFKVMPRRTILPSEIGEKQRAAMQRFSDASRWAYKMTRSIGSSEYEKLLDEFSKQKRCVSLRGFLIAKYLKEVPK